MFLGFLSDTFLQFIDIEKPAFECLKSANSVIMGVIKGVEIRRSAQFSAEIHRPVDFQPKFRAPVIRRIDAVDRKNQDVTAFFLQDNRWWISQTHKTDQNSIFSESFSRKSAPGRDEEFRRSVEKLPEFRIPQQIFPLSRCSTKPDDPHVIERYNIGNKRRVLTKIENFRSEGE